MCISEMRPAFLILSIFLVVGVIPSVSAGELKLYENNSVTIDGANSTIVWGQNYTLNITEFNLYNETLEINRTGDSKNYNISTSSNTSEWVTSTLYNYSLFSSPEFGETVLQIETSATSPSTVNYRFTGVPEISSEHYVLRRDREQVSTFGAGGDVSWSYSNWESNHVFSLVYEEKPKEDADGGREDEESTDDGADDDSIDIGGKLSIAERLSDSRSWSFVNRSQFIFDSIRENIDLERIKVRTGANSSSFQIQIRKLREVPVRLQVENQRSLYSINASSPDNEINSTTIWFAVNRSFATHYDKVVLSRYHEGQWLDLPTLLVESSGEKWLYEALTAGFSYYTVTGENVEVENETQQKSNQTNEQEQQKWGSPSDQTGQHDQAEELVMQAAEHIERGEIGYQKLQKAQQELQRGNYQQARSLAQQLIRENQSQDTDGLPWLLIAAAITLIIVFAALVGCLYYR